MAQIKSEKAKNHLELYTSYCGVHPSHPGIWAVDAEKAVELAEYDARKRASRAFKETCYHRAGSGWCTISYTPVDDEDNYDEAKPCDDYCSECYMIREFLKHYDNEN